MEIAEKFITVLLGKISDPVILVLLALIAGLSYLHVVWRREERDDRNKMLDVLGKNTEALNGVRNVLSALTGKAL